MVRCSAAAPAFIVEAPGKQRPSLEPRTTPMQVTGIAVFLFTDPSKRGVCELRCAWFEARRPAAGELVSSAVRGERLTMRGAEFAKSGGRRAVRSRSEVPARHRIRYDTTSVPAIHASSIILLQWAVSA